MWHWELLLTLRLHSPVRFENILLFLGDKENIRVPRKSDSNLILASSDLVSGREQLLL